MVHQMKSSPLDLHGKLLPEDPLKDATTSETKAPPHLSLQANRIRLASISSCHSVHSTDSDGFLHEVQTFVGDADAVDQVRPKAPDGGWGWMCVFGCTLMHFCLGGFARCYGIIFIELQEKFGTSATIAAWIGGLSTAIRMGFSPVGTALSNRFSPRKTIFVGGLLLGLAGIVSSQAPRAEFLFFSWSFLGGMGGTLMYAPYIVVVSQYFDKRRSLALGIACAGSGFGAFAYPPLVEYLFSHYDYSGCMLIVGAVAFHPCIGGALARPLTAPCDHQAKVKSSVPQNKEGKQTCELKDAESPPMAKKGLERYLDLSLWKNCTFVCFALSMGVFTMSYVTSQMLIAALAVENGATLQEGAMMAAALGLADTVGRFAGGVLFDMRWVRQRRRHIFNAFQLVSGITMFLWASISLYAILMAVSITHGFFNGIVVSQRATVLSDLIGIEHISSSFGLTVFVQGVGLVVGPLIAGALRDLTGGFFYSFFFTGVSATGAAGLLLAEYLLHQGSCRTKKSKKQSTTAGTAAEEELQL